MRPRKLLRIACATLLGFASGSAAGARRDAIVTSGERRVYVAAQAALDSHGVLARGAGLEAQTRRSFANLKTALAAAGAGLPDLVRLDVNVLSTEDPSVVRRILAEEFPPGLAPNEMILPVGALSPAGSLVQIAGLAVTAKRPGQDGVTHLSPSSMANPHQNAAVSIAQSRGVLYLSGQNDSAAGRRGRTRDMSELMRRCIEGLEIALKGGGATLGEVANVVVYASSLRQLEEVQAVYRANFAPGKAPATSYVARSAEDKGSPWMELDVEAAMPPDMAPPKTREYLNPPGLAAFSVFTYVVRPAAGRTVYLNGQTAPRAGEPEAEAKAIYERFSGSLREAGCGFADVVKIRTFLTPLAGVMEGINAVRAKFYPPGRPPASTLLGWDATSVADARMQIDATAVCR